VIHCSPPFVLINLFFPVRRCTMKTLLILTIFLFVFSSSDQCFGQAPPEQLVPLPDFAEYQPEFSKAVLALALEMEDIDAMERSTYDGRRHIQYEAIDMDVKIYTTSHSIEEVRELYFDLFINSMQQTGMPSEALEDFEEFLEYEVIETVEEEPMLDFDLDMIEGYYSEAGLTEMVGWIGCYRELQPEIENIMKKTFMLEMDELMFRQPDTIEDGSNFYIVEVEVEQPYVDIVDCRLVDDTIIIYSIYQMVVSIE